MLNRRHMLAALAAGGAALKGAAALAQEAGSGAAPPLLPDPGPMQAPAGAPVAAIRYAFSVSVFFSERISISSPFRRAFVPAIGGEIWGPRLQGRVIPYGGADFGGGGGPLDAHYMFQADDGALIYINNRGYMKAEGPTAPTPPGDPAPGEPFSQRMGGTSMADTPLRMRTTPFFDAPQDSPHAWMNSTLFIGHGARHVNPDHTLFTYYEVL